MQEYLIINHLKTKDLIRIFSKIHVSTERFYSETPCWEWAGKICSDGYVRTGIQGQASYLHRIVYAWLVAPIPNGKGRKIPLIDHLCNNQKCCNPVHLKLTSPKENVLRGDSLAAKNSRKTHCPAGHPYTERSRYTSKGITGRLCHKCHASRQRRRLESASAREYNRQKAKEWRLANPEKILAYRAKKKSS